MLIAASFIFYASWNPMYLGLLLASIAMNYAISRRLRSQAARRKTWLAAGIALNLLILGYFKYTHFLLDVIAAQFRIEAIILPLGVSFFTFQQIMFLTDIYRAGQAASMTRQIFSASEIATSEFSALESIIDLARRENVALSLFVPPYHRCWIDASRSTRQAGLSFDGWMRELTARARRHGIELWDFAEANPASAGPIGEGSRYYLDPSHFSPLVGRWILHRLRLSAVRRAAARGIRQASVRSHASPRIETFEPSARAVMVQSIEKSSTPSPVVSQQ